MRILLVEDTLPLAESLCAHLRLQHHTVDHADTLAHASQFWRLYAGVYELVILDIELPDGEGSTLLKRIRQTDAPVGVLVLTARSEIDDKVHFLDIGADDYLTKPFELAELDARLRAVYRRRLPKSGKMIPLGCLGFDPLQRTLWHGDRQVELRAQELKLLEALLNAPGQFADKNTLLNRLYDSDQEASDNAVEVHISRLRKRLEPFEIRIKTMRGQGYQLKVGGHDE